MEVQQSGAAGEKVQPPPSVQSDSAVRPEPAVRVGPELELGRGDRLAHWDTPVVLFSHGHPGP